MAVLVTIVSVSMPAIAQSYAYSVNVPGSVKFRFYYAGDGWKPGLQEDIESSDIVIADLMGTGRDLYLKISESVKRCKGIRICTGGMALRLNRLGKYDEAERIPSPEDQKNLEKISMAWKRAEEQDMGFIYSLLLGEYLGIGDIGSVPYRYCNSGVYIKDPITLEEYLSAESYGNCGQYDVALVYSGSNYPDRTLPVARRLFEKLSGFASVLPIAMNSYSIRNADDFRAVAGKPKIIVNLLPFRFMAGPMGGDSVSAEKLLKELDVPVLSPFISANTSEEAWKEDPAGTGPMEYMLNIFLPEMDGSLCTIPAGFKRNTGKPGDLVSLYEIAPCEERLDRICGKVKGYLSLGSKKNSEKRIALISYNYPPGEDNLFGGSFLDGSGSISGILSLLKENGYDTGEMSAEEIVSYFIGNGILNDGKWHGQEKIPRYHSENGHDNIASYWGKAPGEIMVSGGDYLIPGLIMGNVFIGLQPPRSGEKTDPGIYHDLKMPPHHQYLAFYDWIINEFKADAVIHIGTHGTLEFLPGKETAVSGNCFPDYILGNVPHFYLYYAGNPSEAVIAKRRSHACIISYMPPPFVKSGLYGSLAELEELISEYRESSKTDKGRAETVLRRLSAGAEKLRLPQDIEELEDELVSIRDSLIPSGLHRFGDKADRKSGEDFAAEAAGFGSVQDPERVITAYCENLESENLIRALDSRYIEASAGGDIMKDPGILPAGRNIVQFNPDRVPSYAAFERGSQAAEEAVRQFYENEGRYPESAAIILWGLETSRTRGMSLGQICGYLGIRMVSDSGAFSERFEVIPSEEMKRPRVDVVITMCGFFRDMFPKLIEGIGTLFRKVSDYDDNAISRHSMENMEYLKKSGITDKKLAECRLFGPSDGNYGTSITETVERSGWENESELGDLFTDALHYAYISRTAREVPGLLRENQKRVELITQIRDSADRDIIDLDHYFEFLGGLSRSVENARGKPSESYVVDASGPAVKTMDLRRSIERGVRTRLLNPKWAEGLLRTGYHGAQNISERFTNVLGLAATTGKVDTGIFSDMAGFYVRDEEMRRRMMENNCWAYVSMLERLSEAHRRGYWDADASELEELENAYIEAEERLETDTDQARSSIPSSSES